MSSITHHLKAFFGSRRLNEIKPFLIRHYVRDRLSCGVAKATINRELACAKHIFNVAKGDKKAVSNPVREVKLFRETPAGRVFTCEDEEKLLANAEPHIRSIVKLALCTGMRRGELLNLQWENVDMERRVIRVVKTKNDRTREIPFESETGAELRELKPRREGYVLLF